jgi:glucose-1-phosphate thymidylyltransferase
LKALILSGGSGTRLRPITHTSAKQLVPVANKPVLFYALEAVRDAGITDVGIIVGDTRDEVKAAVGDGSRWGLKTTYINQDAPRGLAHTVMIAEPFLKDDPFVMFLGDNLIKDGIISLVREFEKDKPNAQILLSKVREPERFGVAELKNGKIVRLIEKPKEPASDLALVGVYMFDKNIFDAVKAIKPSWRDELEITDAIQYMVDQGLTVTPHIINGWWKDTGKREDILEANMIMLEGIPPRQDGSVDAKTTIEGNVVVERGAVVTNSRLIGPVIIGENAKIKDAIIGPYASIYFNTNIENAQIENSVVLEGTSIVGPKSRLVDCLIGKNVEIRTVDHRPDAYSFMVGDNSQIDII